jgi:hypothetical protein
MKVQAIADGFYGGERKRAGAVFEVKDGASGKWFEPVEDSTPVAKPKAKPAKKDEPLALGELQKAQPVSEREVI